MVYTLATASSAPRLVLHDVWDVLVLKPHKVRQGRDFQVKKKKPKHRCVRVCVVSSLECKAETDVVVTASNQTPVQFPFSPLSAECGMSPHVTTTGDWAIVRFCSLAPCCLCVSSL